MHISDIRLDNVLPRVFVGGEHDAPIKDSQIWCRDITFNKGDIYLIEAESGTGKSSLCSYIYGLRDDYQGHIYFDDSDVRQLSINQWCELRRTSLALLPQELKLFGELTALENVEIKNKLTHHLTQDEIKEMFERLEIGAKLNQPAAKLSIGQQQRVAIIRALAQPFDFLILDEPVSHLDERNNQIVSSMISEHAAMTGAAIITTSVGNPLLLKDGVKHVSL